MVSSSAQVAVLFSGTANSLLACASLAHRQECRVKGGLWDVNHLPSDFLQTRIAAAAADEAGAAPAIRASVDLGTEGADASPNWCPDYADRDSDENFAFIAGYTPGGTPFGITWEEWEKLEQN